MCCKQLIEEERTSDIMEYALHECPDVSYVLLVLMILSICWVVVSVYKKKTQWVKHMPPGPYPWPLLGNLPALSHDKRTYRVFQQIGQQNGWDVFTVFLGRTPAIVLNSADTYKEALLLRQDHFSGRPLFFSIDVFTNGGKGMVFGALDAVWKKQRHLTHSALRRFASGDNLERIVYTSLEKIQQYLDAQNEAFDPLELLSFHIFNIISIFTTGHLMDMEDEKFQKIMSVMNKQLDNFGEVMVADVFPAFKHFYKYFPTKAYKNLFKFEREVLDYLKALLRAQRKVFASGHTDNFLSLLVDFERKQSAVYDAEPDEPYLEEEHLVRTMGDVYGAGVDSSRFTLHWMLQFLAKYPEVQQRMYDEIHRNIGSSLPVRVSHRRVLPYNQAVLLEVMRLRPIIPMTVPHITLRDTTLGAYSIPKDTYVFGNIWSLHTDPRYWEKPLEFLPERFLDDEGDIISSHESFMPFSCGRRACVGQAFVKASLFLTATSLIQNYRFTAPDPATLTLEDEQNAVFMLAKSYKIIVERR